MGIPAGGKNYKLVSEQARRISACRLTFLTVWNTFSTWLFSSQCDYRPFRLDTETPALRRLGPVEDVGQSLSGTPSPQGHREGGQRGHLQPEGTVAAEFVGRNGASNLPVITTNDDVTLNDGTLAKVHRGAQTTLVNQCPHRKYIRPAQTGTRHHYIGKILLVP